MTKVEPIDREWLAFRSALERAIGVPLGQYKEPQMKRRMASLMARHGVTSWALFAKAIATDKKVLNDVQDTLTINVSEFFRQPDRFQELQKVHLPRLLKERPRLRIWSAGCSIGCEPYTLAMVLNEVDPRGAHTIIATDVDAPILARATAGTNYPPAEVRSVPPEFLRKYFTFNGTTYRVNDDIRRNVTFRRHDLLKDAYPPDLDMVLCRNVVIYFTEEAKSHIYRGFANVLRPNGMLFIGGSEMIIRSAEIGLRTAGTSIYLKAA
jgi:chemotaxis protein methyltransferase CheR